MFDKDDTGVGRGGSSEFTNLLILIKLWHGDWKNQQKKINQKLDEKNRKALIISNGRYQKFRRFSINEFCKNIGCIVSAPT